MTVKTCTNKKLREFLSNFPDDLPVVIRCTITSMGIGEDTTETYGISSVSADHLQGGNAIIIHTNRGESE